MSGPCTALGSRTTVLQLCKPASGEVGWHTSVNGNMDELDALFTGASLLKPANGGSGLNASAAANGKTLLGNGTGFTLALPTGSASIIITAGAGTLAFDTVQSIATGASPAFAGLTVAGLKAMTQFFPAQLFQVTSTAALPVMVRFAANDYGLSRTAAGAETINYSLTLPLILSVTANKGMRLDSFSLVHQITVQALTSNVFTALATVTYANNIANAVAAHGGGVSIAAPTAVQAAPYVTAATITTPAFVNATAKQINIDWTVVLQNLGIYTVYGVIANYSAGWF